MQEKVKPIMENNEIRKFGRHGITGWENYEGKQHSVHFKQ